ncbi:hypothetical protein KGY79_10270 [Candidatus Bipolaricaulota bacterium]|nr:hypothetical protein [Candidatus Bipolaricaulota bacterium]
MTNKYDKTKTPYRRLLAYCIQPVKISEGYLRSRHRNSLEKAELLEPNVIYEYNFNMSYTTKNTFEPGH